LIERVSRLAFALENHLLAVSTEVTFARAGALEGELPDARNKRRFGFLSTKLFDPTQMDQAKTRQHTCK
jgi:hypothetical protein